MTIGRVAQRYAVAIFEAASEQGHLDDFARDAELIDRGLDASRELLLFFKSPVLSMDMKLRMAVELLGDKTHPFTRDLILFLIRQRREEMIREIFHAFFVIRRTRRNIESARVTSAVPLDGGQKDRLVSQLRSMIKKEVEIAYDIDPRVRGGLVVRVGDMVYDGSVARQLERMRRRFVGSAAG